MKVKMKELKEVDVLEAFKILLFCNITNNLKPAELTEGGAFDYTMTDKLPMTKKLIGVVEGTLNQMAEASGSNVREATKEIMLGAFVGEAFYHGFCNIMDSMREEYGGYDISGLTIGFMEKQKGGK